MTWVTMGILVLAAFPIWGALVWEIWEGFIKPSIIPEREIDALARDMLRQFGENADLVASMNENRAWHYCESFEQGKWRRVREKLKHLKHVRNAAFQDPLEGD